jgi:hypothetical protein
VWAWIRDFFQQFFRTWFKGVRPTGFFNWFKGVRPTGFFNWFKGVRPTGHLNWFKVCSRVFVTTSIATRFGARQTNNGVGDAV